MELVFAADLHIRRGAWNSLPSVVGDAKASWEQIVTYCADHHDRIAGLVLGGDIFDARPEPPDVECFLKGVRLLAKLNVKIYAIQGQHGRHRELPWTSIDPYVQWIHGTPPVELPGNIFMTGFDNMPPDELHEAITKLDPRVDILVIHQKCKGSLPEIAGNQNWDFDPEWVPKHVKLVLMGDVHKPWETRVIHDLETKASTLCVYSGSTAMQAVDEPPEKSFLLVKLPELTYTRVMLKTRPFVSLLLTDEIMLLSCLEQVANLAPDTLVLVRHDSRIPAVEQRLRDVNKKVHFMFRLLPLDTVPGEIVTPDGDKIETVSLKGCLSSAVDPQQKPVLYDLLANLLDKPDTKGVLTDAKSRFFGTT